MQLDLSAKGSDRYDEAIRRVMALNGRLIEGICARIRAEKAKPMTVIGTGGLSTLFAQGTDVLQKIDQDLTIHGLVLIDRMNRE